MPKFHHEYLAFVEHLKANPFDEDVHKIFADWLDDNDEPEEADLHRRFVAEWKEAYQWMKEFAEKEVTEGYGSGYLDELKVVSVEDVLEAADKHVANSTDTFCLSGMGFDAESAMKDEDLKRKFWECYEILVCCKVSEDLKSGDGPFRCSC